MGVRARPISNSEWRAVQGQLLTVRRGDRLDLEAVIMKLRNTPEFAGKVLEFPTANLVWQVLCSATELSNGPGE